MAAPSYTEDLTDLSTAESNTNWVEMSGTIGGEVYNAQGAPAGGDGDYPFIQGSFSVTQDCTKDTAVGSLAYNNGAGTGGHGTDGAYFVWQNFMVASNIGTYAQGGFQIVVGSTEGDFDAWYTGGVDKAPYPYGGWVNNAINTTVTPDGTAGTPGATEQYIGAAVYVITGSSKGEVHNTDAVRYGRGSAIFELGDLANGYATIEGFAILNDNNTNRWGLIQETSGGYLWKGRMQLGTATNAVDFRDSNISIFIQWTPKVTANFNLIEVINASSNVEMTGIQITTLDTTTASRGRFLMTDNAIVAISICTFTDMSTFEFLSNATIIDSSFVRCDLVTQNGAIFDGCSFINHQASTGSPATIDAALLVDDLTIITNCDFLGGGFGSPAGVGHAIEISTAAAVGSPTSFDLTGNTFTNFGADGTTDAAIYNNSGTQIILNILSGDTPTILNGTGSSTIINNSVTITVQGVTEGAAIKVVANETVGTITIGDVILEALADSNGEASTSINYEGSFEPSGLDVITRARSSGLPTAAIQDDNGVFTNETTAANSAVSADMHLLPTTPVVNEDRYLFGHAEKFNNMKIDINTAGTGGFTITWQYWNGAWTNLTGVVDGTSSFSVLGENYISFTMPGDWTTTTINGQGPYYYVRAAYTAGTVTVVPLGTRCALDVTKYLPFVQDGTVTSTGLTVTASWNEDTIATF